MKSVPPKLWRQGDVLIQQIDALPARAHPLHSSVLFEGEASGHQHRVKDKRSARLLFWGGFKYLEVLPGGAEIVHPEHAAVMLEPGCYRVWQQREYVDAGHAPRNVAD